MQQLARVCGNYLIEKGKVDSSIWVLDGDLADSDGADAFAEHNSNFIQAGIAEQNMISMAAGLATTNCKPWVFSFAAFLCFRGYDQIRASLSHTCLPVVLVGSHAGACTGRNGKSHASLNDIAMMSSLPNIQIWTPGDASDVHYAVDTIMQEGLPAYLRCPRDALSLLPEKGSVKPAFYRWIGEPSKIALCSHGYSTHWAVAIQNELKNHGIEVGVLHFCKLWPLDTELLAELTKNVEIAYVIEDHYPIGGLASFLHYLKFDFEITSLAWPLDWHSQSGTAADLLQFHGLDSKSVAEKILYSLQAV
jgi:transketolase